MGLLRCLLLLLCLAGMAVVAVPAPPVVAQQPDAAPDYEAWEKVATRAENAIEAGRASILALEELRNELVRWRQQFQDAQNVNSNAIATVQAQLDALGPEPEGGDEAEDVATRRAALKEQLAALQAPVKTAELAYRRADGLIKGIDQIIRERQTEELLEFGPSPLNPKHWDAGFLALYTSVETLRNEFATAWGNPALREEAQEDLPAVIVLLVIGLVLLFRGKQWSKWLVNLVLKGHDEASSGRWISAFVASLGVFFLPLVGAFALIEAIYATGLVGLRGDHFLAALLPAVAIYLLARWLSMRIFPAHDMRQPLLNLDPAQRRTGRLYGASLGLTIAVFSVLYEMSRYSNWPEAASNVVLFPIIVIAGLLLLRLARLLSHHDKAMAEEQTEETYRGRLGRLFSRALVVLAVLAPVLAAVGYFKAAEALMLPSLLSLMLIAALLVLQRVLTEIYALISGNSDSVGESLIPILLGSLLVLLSVPVFALIWGARVADLTELWTQFTEGIYLGDIRISPTIFLKLAFVFALGFLLTRLLQGALRNTVLPKTRLDTGGRNAVVAGVGYVGIFLAAIIAITSAGIDLSSLAIVAGALSVGIGFGLQNIVSNFVSGIILLIERPISEGDWIEVGGQMGYVRDISVRSTRIETFDRTDVIVPNADFVSGTVTNYTRGNTVGRVIVPVGVAYGTDPRKVEGILREIAEAHPMVLANPPPNVVFRGFGADSLDFEIRAILRDVNWMLNVHSDMNYEIADRFAKEGIEIPFAQRDVWLRNPETLQPPSARAPETGGAGAGEAPGTEKAAVHLTESDMDGDRDGDGGDSGR